MSDLKPLQEAVDAYFEKNNIEIFYREEDIKREFITNLDGGLPFLHGYAMDLADLMGDDTTFHRALEGVEVVPEIDGLFYAKVEGEPANHSIALSLYIDAIELALDLGEDPQRLNFGILVEGHYQDPDWISGDRYKDGLPPWSDITFLNSLSESSFTVSDEAESEKDPS